MHKLILGDCLHEMKSIKDGSVDLILCDPPYGTTACKWDSVIPLDEMWLEYWRVLKNNGAAVIFAAQPFTTTLISSQISHFRYQYVWIKNTQTGIALAKYQPMRKHEDICVFYRKHPTYNKQMVETESEIMLNHSAKGYSRGDKKYVTDHLPNMSLKREPFSRMINPSTVLKFNSVSNRSSIKTHPTQKPVDLLEFLIKTYTNEGDVVLDSCMGSGSTGIACSNLNRNFIGIEKDDRYFDLAKKWIENMNQFKGY